MIDLTIIIITFGAGIAVGMYVASQIEKHTDR